MTRTLIARTEGTEIWLDQLDVVRDALAEPILSAEDQIERKIDGIIRELDELCGMASNCETVDLVETQRIGVGQIVTRATLIASFLMARQPQHLRIISRG